MESRREFLRTATVTLVLIPLGAAACGATMGSTGASGCDGVGATSSVVGGHSHTVCVDAVALSSPPGGGMTFSTSTSQNHSHTVTLTQAELKSIASGGEVTVVTSSVLSHTHEFMLVKMSQPPAAAGGGGGGGGGGGTGY